MSRAEAAHSAGLFAPAPRHARGSAFAPRYTATVKGGDSEGRKGGQATLLLEVLCKATA